MDLAIMCSHNLLQTEVRQNRNIVERTGATSELSSRRNLVGMLSGPDA